MFESVEHSAENMSVIKGQIRQSLDGKPAGAGGVIATDDHGGLSDENRYIYNRNGVPAGIPARFAKGPELAERQALQPRLFLDLPVNGRLYVLTVIHKSAG
jgi:hypothetical protein